MAAGRSQRPFRARTCESSRRKHGVVPEGRRDCQRDRRVCTRAAAGLRRDTPRVALRRGKTASRGMACRTPGNDRPRERRPTRIGAGAPALVVSSTLARCIGTGNRDGVFPICGALRPLSCGCGPPGADGTETVTPQLIALSARSERLSRSLSSWARSAGRSLGGSV